jgi:hypothetical protein
MFSRYGQGTKNHHYEFMQAEAQVKENHIDES